MPTRRQIREAAVQLFYARASTQTAESDDELWDLINDRPALAFDRSRVKVLGHWMKGRSNVAQDLTESLSNCTAAITAADPSGKAGKDFVALTSGERQIAEKLENLVILTKNDTGAWRRSLHECFELSRKQQKSRNELIIHVENFPPQQSETIGKLFAKLDLFDERLEKVRAPERHTDQRELSHLNKTLDGMRALRDDANEVIRTVSDNLPVLNKTITTAAENYDLDRLSRVDLSILRLAASEILFMDDIPDAVAINEAVELARSFSGEDSAAFVNGLLDKIAREKKS
ncbi:MAG: transcription antitermination factor NusB [Akkermansiaceae bacterium]